MKWIIFALALFPTIIFASYKEHKVHMVFSVVDEKNRAVVVQDVFVGKTMFDQLIEDDKNLTFIGDIGFKYISAITVEMNNDTYEINQNIILKTVDGKMIAKSVLFFILSTNTSDRYILAPSKFENKTYLSSLSY